MTHEVGDVQVLQGYLHSVQVHYVVVGVGVYTLYQERLGHVLMHWPWYRQVLFGQLEQ